MNIEQIKEKADKIKWQHVLELKADDGQIYTTKGQPNRCSIDTANNYLGIPQDLSNKTVLDIGAWDGYFSFLSESRGAKVKAIDRLQNYSKNPQAQGFFLAKEILKSNVDYEIIDLETFAEKTNQQFDIVYSFGIMYHVEEPVKHIHALSKVTKEFALIETAISQLQTEGNIWEFKHKFFGDPYNFWYPTVQGLESVLLYAGFNKVEFVGRRANRVTVKAIKNDK
jgi:tRNA (mo5U34)-methyltransferase